MLAILATAVVITCFIMVKDGAGKSELQITKTGEVPGDIIYTYGHPLNSPSEVVWIKDGHYQHHTILKGAVGIGYIQADKEGHLWTPSTRNNKLYKLTSDYQVETSTTPGQTQKFKIIEGTRISSHSSGEINFHVLNYASEAKQFQMKLEGFLREFTREGDKLYIFADLIAKEKSVLYVLDIPSEKVMNTIPLPEGVADDMVVYQDKVVLATKTSLTVVDRSDWKVSTIKLSYPDVRPVSLYNRNGHLYVALRSDVDLSGLKLIKMDSNFKEISKVDLGIVHSGGDQFKDDKYYVYSGEGDPEKKFSGELSVYQLYKLN
ncbi:hypothetical protein M5W68_21625 [Paenibacillus larvae]|nr:hypothetical protein [Paenibacillus larvae]MCY9527620.1 hypothetical protein [Paenibacillus larvae]